ncbi:MAG: IclR family transcriptional regulator [Halarchaeum sp.]
MAHGDGSPPVKTTRTSLDVLDVVRDADGTRLRDVMDELGLAKSTAHKHLTTLEDAGYLLKEGETYHLGMKLLNLGEHARERWSWYTEATNAVDELTERTDEECDFVVEDRGRIITIAESYHKWVKFGERGSSKRYRAYIGTYYPMHATATGLAILATYPSERVDAVIDRWGLPAMTDSTITTRAALFEELARVDERGYAVDDEYYTDGLRSVAKAVTGPDGSVLGSLGVSGPTYHVDGPVLESELPRALVDVVESLESELTTTDGE